MIGESLMDILNSKGKTREVPGGSAANVALALGRLGRTVRLKTALAEDSRGEDIVRWLEQSGVEVDASPIERTSTARADIGSNGAAHYSFDIVWKLDSGAACDALVVHSGSIGALLLPGAEHVEKELRAHRNQSTISLDPNIRASLIADEEDARARLERLLGIADIIKVSDEDLGWLCPGESPADVAHQWLTAGSAIVAVTFGQGGVSAFTRSGQIHLPAKRVPVVDTIGAGDTFMAALLSELLEHSLMGADKRQQLRELARDVLEEVVQRSIEAASITVSREGANPPTRSELDRLLMHR